MKLFKPLPPTDRHTECLYCNYMGCIWYRTKYGPKLGHYVWAVELLLSTIVKRYRTFVLKLTALDYSQIEDVEIDGIDYGDYPDFCDAFVASATYKGRDMSESELDRLNQDGDFVYEAVQNKLF